MAVKPITNKSVVASSQINRGYQRSTKDSVVRDGNKSRSYIPGANYSKNYAITLKDIDKSIMGYLKNVIKPTVEEANENIKVTVMYGNEERWKAVRKRGVVRDKNGSLVLPLIMLKRTEVSKKDTLPLYHHDLKGDYTDVVRNSKWSKLNRYDRFTVQTGKNPVYESIVTSIPNFVNITYEFILWTGFIEQMNPLTEMIMEENQKYWGETEEHKFLCTLDSVSDASEMNQDGERFIKSTFSLSTSAYLLPEYANSIITNKVANTQKVLSTSRVVFGYEGDATNKQVGK